MNVECAITEVVELSSGEASEDVLCLRGVGRVTGHLCPGTCTSSGLVNLDVVGEYWGAACRRAGQLGNRDAHLCAQGQVTDPHRPYRWSVRGHFHDERAIGGKLYRLGAPSNLVPEPNLEGDSPCLRQLVHVGRGIVKSQGGERYQASPIVEGSRILRELAMGALLREGHVVGASQHYLSF